jgi:hypothetical protein
MHESSGRAPTPNHAHKSESAFRTNPVTAQDEFKIAHHNIIFSDVMLETFGYQKKSISFASE